MGMLVRSILLQSKVERVKRESGRRVRVGKGTEREGTVCDCN